MGLTACEREHLEATNEMSLEWEWSLGEDVQHMQQRDDNGGDEKNGVTAYTHQEVARRVGDQQNSRLDQHPLDLVHFSSSAIRRSLLRERVLERCKELPWSSVARRESIGTSSPGTSCTIEG